MLKAERKDCGQCTGGPNDVSAQSNDRMRCAISLSFERSALNSGIALVRLSPVGTYQRKSAFCPNGANTTIDIRFPCLFMLLHAGNEQEVSNVTGRHTGT